MILFWHNERAAFRDRRMSIRVGVDIGGTFTDFCVYDDATGVMQTFKTFSTPTTPGAEVMNGVAELERGLAIRQQTSAISPMARPSA